MLAVAQTNLINWCDFLNLVPGSDVIISFYMFFFCYFDFPSRLLCTTWVANLLHNSACTSQYFLWEIKVLLNIYSTKVTLNLSKPHRGYK